MTEQNDKSNIVKLSTILINHPSGCGHKVSYEKLSQQCEECSKTVVNADVLPTLNGFNGDLQPKRDEDQLAIRLFALNQDPSHKIFECSLLAQSDGTLRLIVIDKRKNINRALNDDELLKAYNMVKNEYENMHKLYQARKSVLMSLFDPRYKSKYINAISGSVKAWALKIRNPLLVKVLAYGSGPIIAVALGVLAFVIA